MTSPSSYQPGSGLPIEFALAVACCRWAYSGEGENELRRLAEAVDWGCFLKACRRHRVQGLAWQALSGLDIALPAPVRIALAGDARAIAEHGLRAARESARLTAAFRDAGLPLLFLKGLALGKLAYGNAFLKMGWDLDVLVRPEDIGAAGHVLAALGHALKIPGDINTLAAWHGRRNQSLWSHSDGLFVELHSQLTELPGMLPSLTASSPSQSVEVAPGIALATLADDELFAYLCVHGGWSAWFRLKWLADVAALLHGRATEAVEVLYDRSQELGAERSTAQGLLLAHMLFATPLPPTLAERLATPVNRWLARLALRAMLHGEPTERPLGTMPIHLGHFFLRRGLGYKLAELRRKLHAVILDRL
jgi:hypothetical protein